MHIYILHPKVRATNSFRKLLWRRHIIALTAVSYSQWNVCARWRNGPCKMSGKMWFIIGDKDTLSSCLYRMIILEPRTEKYRKWKCRFMLQWGISKLLVIIFGKFNIMVHKNLLISCSYPTWAYFNLILL